MPPAVTPPSRAARERRLKQRAEALGRAAEERAASILEGEGWTIRGRRVRTQAGEIDLIAERAGLLVFLEVKARPRLAEAAAALTTKQRARLLRAASTILATHPDWGASGVRFDVIVVDRKGTVRRITDAFREE